ncbi:RNase J family beta-CASP ribonuclease [Candidatus Peregrinibacteria bacterium]|nr:RNase J family beta-CASP ribonuclease [Candidatus Peregrinibacteria bacterium]
MMKKNRKKKPFLKRKFNKGRSKSRRRNAKLKIIPLGGLNEVGKNMMVFEYGNDIIIVDMGFEFPSEDMLGIDYVIPDVNYLEKNKKRIRGVIITHGHLDHTGGIPYILPKLGFPPVFGTKLTMGFIKKKIDEFKLDKFAKLNVINPDKPLKLGAFLLNFFRVVHSIPDPIGVIIDTPAGKIVHTGDFKFDDSPAGRQKKADIHKMKALRSQNVLALFSDSTNALKKGATMSEAEVQKALEDVFKKVNGRLIISSFSSLIGRIQQIIDLAQKYNRKVFVSGKSMIDNIAIAVQLGYLHYPKGLVKDIRKYKKVKDEQTLILTTGSQGESVSALTRISNNLHKNIKIKKGDTIVLSASPIIGNEKAIASVINNLCILGATVIHHQLMDVHTSGHGHQDDLKRMINYVRPKYLVPVHGEYFMRQGHALLAQEECGIPEDRTILIQNGDVLVAQKGKLEVSKQKIETKYILIDGSGEGTIGSRVQVDREIMSLNGALIVLIFVSRKSKKLKGDPNVISRGFIYMHETEEITTEVSKAAAKAFKKIMKQNPGANRRDIKKYIKQSVDKFTNSKLERRPLIIPLIVEV